MLLLRELAQLYAAATGAGPEPPPPALQFADFARWQQAFAGTAEGRRQLAHWQARLDRAPHAAAAAGRPPARPRASVRGGQVAPPVAPALVGELQALAATRA